MYSIPQYQNFYIFGALNVSFIQIESISKEYYITLTLMIISILKIKKK